MAAEAPPVGMHPAQAAKHAAASAARTPLPTSRSLGGLAGRAAPPATDAGLAHAARHWGHFLPQTRWAAAGVRVVSAASGAVGQVGLPMAHPPMA